jgi:hypothetical protein
LVFKFFPYLGEKEIEIFLSISTYQIAGNNETILKSGKTDKTIMLILQAAASTYNISKDGRELSEYLKAEGYIIAGPKVFNDEIQNLTIESIGETHFL